MREPVASPIVGFRVWRVYKRQLIPLNNAHARDTLLSSWRPGETAEAVNAFILWNRTVAGHGARHPTPSNEIGFHVYREVDTMMDRLTAPRGPVETWPMIGGAVVIWGIIQMHEIGYRAQYAKPIAMLDSKPHIEIDDKYGIPYLDRDELVEYAKWWGTLIPNEAKDENG